VFRLIKSLLDPRPYPWSRLGPTIIEDARPDHSANLLNGPQPSHVVTDGDPDASWGEAWARAESASAALASALARVTATRLAFEAALAESDEAVRIEEAAYKAMMAAKANSTTVH
jgi:hypothetical protein